MNNIFNIQKILNFFNYVFYFFVLNLVFLFFNIPLLSFIFLIGISNIETCLPLFLITLIPFGPSITMLIYCMGKLIKNKDLDLVSDIKLSLKLNFRQAFFVWSLELLIIFILNVNIKFFSKYSVILSGIFLLISLMILFISPYIYVLISRFSMNTKDIVKNSIILTFTRPIISIANILSIIFTLILFEISPGTTFLFIGSILAFLISYCNKFLLSELENKASRSN
ncbi:DUF624 domain-containing protein [Clostridium sp.]|uniref:DUF624 domain-containing protein n=2 Tax=Clostridium TaxID=1485 RepID=UPI0025C04FDF|nr:DUF624 domain-containing protein [Clostridium sp.]MCI9069141.1 DUF624 domain-containing protein [Clostridium sp.]